MSSVVRETLEGYVAGHVPAARVVAVVTAAYYGNRGRGKGKKLKPLIDVIERASPGVVELAGTSDRPGFAVRLGERPFPQQCEAELRGAAEAFLGLAPAGEAGRGKGVAPGVFARLVGMIQRLISASA